MRPFIDVFAQSPDEFTLDSLTYKQLAYSLEQKMMMAAAHGLHLYDTCKRDLNIPVNPIIILKKSPSCQYSEIPKFMGWFRRWWKKDKLVLANITTRGEREKDSILSDTEANVTIVERFLYSKSKNLSKWDRFALAHVLGRIVLKLPIFLSITEKDLKLSKLPRVDFEKDADKNGRHLPKKGQPSSKDVIEIYRAILSNSFATGFLMPQEEFSQIPSKRTNDTSYLTKHFHLPEASIKEFFL